MKTIKKIFLLSLLAGGIYSCSDAYDIVQEGEYQEDLAFQTLDDMALALNEIYDNVSNENIIAFTSVFTDETGIGDENGGQNLSEFRHQLFPTNGYASGIWGGNYYVINIVNRLIEGSENIVVEPGSTDELEKNRILAEARAIRAFSMLQLLTYYSPDLTDDNALGVIILDHVPPTLPDVEQLPRSTNIECINFLNADLDYADEWLIDPASAVFFTPEFILGMRARLAAYRGRWAEAGDYAQQCITMFAPGAQGAANQGLAAGQSQYAGIWSDTNAVTEQIFTALRPSGKSGIVSNWFFNNASLSGGAFLDMGRNLYRDLTEYPNDIRDNVFVGASSLIAPNYATVFDYRGEDVLIINKYPGTPSNNLPLNNNIKVMRIVEMHYIRAEAQVAAGDVEAARASLNFVRRRRNSAGVNNASMDITATQMDTPQEAWAWILKERRIELCFEGHRYIDLKRLGTLAGQPGIDRYERDCEPYNACELSVDDHRFTLPIPNSELNGNQVIQQNPGY
jgi:starch-binding outer membrane protein, SusD/RagB family